MSLVIGYVSKDKDTGRDVMYMASDSCGYGDLTKQEYKNRKLMKTKDGAYVGVIGSFKVQNIISANLKEFNGIKSVRKDVLGRVIPMLSDEIDDGSMSESNVLLMFKDRLLYIQSDLSVLEPAGDAYGKRKCIGAHATSADLVMDTLLSENPDIDPEQLLLKTMGILSGRCDAIGAPFYIVNSMDNRIRKYATPNCKGVSVKGGW